MIIIFRARHFVTWRIVLRVMESRRRFVWRRQHFRNARARLHTCRRLVASTCGALLFVLAGGPNGNPPRVEISVPTTASK